jgi:hypothetical protein
MTSANTNFYQFDGCYSRPSFSSFDASLNLSYNNTLVSSVAECQAEAIRVNADFFFMNDISSVSSTNNSSNCYVPKQLSSNLGSIISENTSLQLFTSLFGTTSGTTVSDTCNNMMFRRTPINNPALQKCFKYTLDDQVYAPKNKYAYYKKPVLNERNMQITASLRTRPTSYYASQAKLNELASYKDLLYINERNLESSGPLYIAFKNFICSPTREKERLFDTQLVDLQSKYTNLINHLDTISTDLSSINLLKADTNNNLMALDARIAIKKQELNNLLGSGGANNGRLSDNVFLTQFKIIENSILLIIMIIACFVYYRTRNFKSITMNAVINTNPPLIK